MQTLEISKLVEIIANEPFLLDLPNPASFREDSRGASGACEEIHPREDILIDKENLIRDFNKKEKGHLFPKPFHTYLGHPVSLFLFIMCLYLKPLLAFSNTDLK
ncbi:hypothetical protein ACJMK2_034799 [Sinanodonta woodiana]|uniref:Uncharacterized protein n=1 Tax=Sinanodonta woodiana TaxID=1069815 RepID=A0ABD3WW96_SINWO